MIGHFERTRQQAKELNVSFLQELSLLLAKGYPVDELLRELQAAGHALPADEARAEKLRLWNQIKIDGTTGCRRHDSTGLVISKTISSIYATSLLSLLIWAQMGIVGRHLYLRMLFLNAKVDPNTYLPHLDSIGKIGKAIMAVSTRFAQSGVLALDTAIGNATSLVLCRVDVQAQVSRADLAAALESIRHEIEGADGRSIIEDCLFQQEVLKEVFAQLNHEERPLANKLLEHLKDTVASAAFKDLLAQLVNKKVAMVLGMACESLFASHQEPLLLSLIPAINAESPMITAPKTIADDDALLTAFMAIVFKSCSDR